ncbi:MAG: HAMP domain-containing protein [Chloroflexi bacterium]|nr:HAMP domain-containing protein [Chloroflexota bacterium]
MKLPLQRLSIRTRLFVVYVAILLLGFGGLTLVAGQQISAGARQDFEERLKSEIALIAQAVARNVSVYAQNGLSETDLDIVFAEYETQINGTLTLIALGNPHPSDDGGRDGQGRPGFRAEPELEDALRGTISLDERVDASGEDTLYTAAQLTYNGQALGLLQLSVPASNLQTMIAQRWLELGIILALVALLGIGAAVWLARSIIQPLYKLRESAVRLSQGDFSHRVHYDHQDEIGEVAHAFNEMAIQVVSMLEEQRAFASNTSHELRTPLTTIRLRTEALRYNKSLAPETAKRYIEEIDDEVERLGNLVQDLTLLSRFDAGRAELGQEQIDLLRFASSLHERMLPLAREKHITLTLIPPPETLIVKASITHLTVIFRNLLDNAIKYTPEDGTITWTIQKTDAGICHTIADTGHGIEAEHLPHLFERFFRVDKARSRDVPGTGLGLALVKSIIEAYGGSITVASSGQDQGTTITVIMPHTPTDLL